MPLDNMTILNEKRKEKSVINFISEEFIKSIEEDEYNIHRCFTEGKDCGLNCFEE